MALPQRTECQEDNEQQHHSERPGADGLQGQDDRTRLPRLSVHYSSEQGYPHEHIELQLAHTPRNAVSAAYDYAFQLKPRAKMMQDWADFLEHTQRTGNVLPFKGTAA